VTGERWIEIVRFVGPITFFIMRVDPQIEIYRRMTPRQRLAAATRLWHMARSLAARGARFREPGLSENEVARRVATQFRNAPR
jgi:hypothetical protein